ncbi:MAG TPA: Ig-like domain-containing protein, partial [Longimicrobiales bacterium]|nr:Ig-like domain-containing protein [Longimicrobiales bacterium]
MTAPAKGRPVWWLLAALTVAPGGCGETSVGPPIEPAPTDRITQLEFVGGLDQEILGGRRSPEPFRVRALDGMGRPVGGATVEFRLTGRGGGILSQPRALTDSLGEAETYLLEARSGPALLRAVAGGASTGLGLEVARAPGSMVFEEVGGAVGLPGKTHPDSVVRVRVL